MNDSLQTAPFWLRAGAYVIDGLAQAAVLMAVAVLAVLGLPAIFFKLATLFVPLLYFIWYPVAHDGQTPGKRLAGIKIVRPAGGFTYPWAAARYVGYMLSALPAGLGFLAAAVTPERKALHDYIAGTRVVEAEDVGDLRRKAVMGVGLALPGLLLLAGILSMLMPGTRAGSPDGNATLGGLLTLRAAGSQYYADNGRFASRLEDLAPAQLASLPEVRLDGAAPTTRVTAYGPEVCTGSEIPGDTVDPSKIVGAGGWGYVIAPQTPCHGFIFVDSKGLDPKGRPWYTH